MFTAASAVSSLGLPLCTPASSLLSRCTTSASPLHSKGASFLFPLIPRQNLRRAKVNRIGRAAPFMAASASGASTEEQTQAESAELELWTRIRAHQKAAPQLSPAEDARTLLQRSKRAVLSTFSTKYAGFPFGSPVSFAVDDEGRPILSISNLSPHTKDLDNNPSCSLLVCKDLADMTETVVTIVGKATQVPAEEDAAARTAFLKKHPDAFWVDFGDFKFVRIEPTTVRHVENVATGIGAAASELTGETYKAAQPDFIAPFAAPIAKHMNMDHADATLAMAEHAIGAKFDSAKIVGLDRLGMQVEVHLGGSRIRLRIPFPKPAEKREDVKSLLVDMTKAAKQAVAPANANTT
eukprot:TRINITY_DN15180_c0_g4_i1.p1 TRINITY_DN15180_c0_g4~~TRINITY_DN15180_c0_g4_i1.p1  ORF type:complete len:352 (-),score=61.42 TRINITY_DN15180_c0_g4_i1:284-1339(-)